MALLIDLIRQEASRLQCKGSLSTAHDLLSESLSYFPSDKGILSDLFSVSRLMGKTELALTYSKKLIETHPHFIGGYHLSAWALIEMKRFREAKDLVIESFQSMPESLRSLLLFCEAAIHLDDMNEARDVARNIVCRYPNDARGYLYLGRILEKQGYIGDAVTTYELGLKMCPSHECAELQKLFSQLRIKIGWENKKKERENHTAARYGAIFLASGGVTHMLCCLGSIFLYCSRSGRVCAPFSEINPHFQLNFYDIFDVQNTGVLLSREEALNVIRDWEYARSAKMSSLRLQSGKNNDGIYYQLVGEGEYNDICLSFPTIESDDKIVLLSGFDQRFAFPPEEKLAAALAAVTLSPQVICYIEKKLALLPKQIIGVHFRNTDYSTQLDAVVQNLGNVINETGISDVYWATDDPDSIVKARKLLPKIKLWNKASIVDAKGMGYPNIHSISDDVLREFGTSKFQQIASFLLDVFVLSISVSFVPSLSTTSVKYLVDLLRKRPDLRDGFFRAKWVIGGAEKGLPISQPGSIPRVISCQKE